MITDIAGFLVCASLITLSGTQLSKQGNLLAEITGFSRAWIGFILMATVTSLPELVTGLSAVAVVKAPDLAVGNVLGSCAFNLLILSFLDLLVKKPITSLVKTSHIVAGSFSIILLSLSGAAILLSPVTPRLLWFSPFTPMLVVVYLAAVRAIFLYEKFHPANEDALIVNSSSQTGSLKRVLSIYGLHAVVVTCSALFW